MNIGQARLPSIAIIGAGFSGTALAAALHRTVNNPCEITLFDKSGRFGAGDAYSTPFPFHLLNVCACDMSIFEDEPDHYVNWLRSNREIQPYLDQHLPLPDQFTPRIFYGTYLKDLLQTMQHDKGSQLALRLVSAEVVDLEFGKNQVTLILKDGQRIIFDKIVLAVGNHAVSDFPFPVDNKIKCIRYPWDYLAPKHIQPDDPVMVAGTGLSMMDMVQTLSHQGHRGKIHAVSRHGLLPLPHADSKVPFAYLPEQGSVDIRKLTRFLRDKSADHAASGGDWRSVINAIRQHAPDIWGRISLPDRKRFIRHLAPYWNIHRHRVHHRIASSLTTLLNSEQLQIIAGRIHSVLNQEASIKLRETQELIQLPVKWLINCMGPSSDISKINHSLMQALYGRGLLTFDELNIGFNVSSAGALKSVNGEISDQCYVIGPARRSIAWEAGAVPEIRKQSRDLAKELLK